LAKSIKLTDGFDAVEKRSRVRIMNKFSQKYPRLIGSMIAGAPAILINTFLLKLAELFGIATAAGGLLILIKPLASKPLAWSGISALWSEFGWMATEGPAFQLAFHLTVGLLMAIVYAYFVEPHIQGKFYRKGLIYSFAVWLLNTLVVLPLTGEGIGGSKHLNSIGMIWYLFAHTSFFLLLAWWYDISQRSLNRPEKLWSPLFGRIEPMSKKSVRFRPK
jgi:hypothetical protein